MQAGLPVRHIENGTKAIIYVTDIETAPAGRFRGPMVVSTRPFTPSQAIRAIQVTSRFPNVHGAPVHFGDPAQIGIPDIDRPYSGPRPTFVRVRCRCSGAAASLRRSSSSRRGHRSGSPIKRGTCW